MVLFELHARIGLGYLFGCGEKEQSASSGLGDDKDKDGESLIIGILRCRSSRAVLSALR